MNTVKDYILKFIYNNDLRDYENKAIINELPKNKKEISILDAGCGSDYCLINCMKLDLQTYMVLI